MSSLRQASADAKIRSFLAVKSRFDAVYKQLLADADAAKSRPEELRILHAGLQSLVMAQSAFHPEMADYEPLVQSVLADLAPLDSTVSMWCDKLRKVVKEGQLRCHYAMLFGQVLAEHAKVVAAAGGKQDDGSLQTTADAYAKVAAAAAAVVAADGESWVDTANAVDYRQRTTATDVKSQAAETKADFIANAKNAPAPDAATLSAAGFAKWLQQEFVQKCDKTGKKSIKSMQEAVTRFGSELRSAQVPAHEIKLALQGLVGGDLLSPERKAEVRTVLEDSVLHAEVANVVNQMLTDLDSWDWVTSSSSSSSSSPAASGARGSIPVSMRREMTGKMRIFLDEDLMTAVFLQWCGVKWSSFFHQQLTSLRTAYSGVWTTDVRGPHDYASTSINLRKRRTERAETYAFGELPPSFEAQASGVHVYDGDGAESDDDSDAYSNADMNADTDAKSRRELKDELLQWVVAEAQVHRLLHPPATPFTVIRTDIKNFGPSILHDHMAAILEFFGMDKHWRQVVRRFLRVPVHFPGAENEGTFECQRGLPIAHAFTALLGELVLFPMEYLVHRRAGHAVTLVRMHDDIWLWSSDPAAMDTAWKACHEYAGMTGLSFSESKTGCAVAFVGADETEIKTKYGFPSTPVRWGALQLAQDGRWAVDEVPHMGLIADCRARLAAAPSVLSWVNTYNRFARFFLRSFGYTSKASGKRHVDTVRNHMRDVHLRIFPEFDGSAVRALMARVVESVRGGMQEQEQGHVEVALLDGWVHWPMAMGGLELLDVHLMLMQATRAFTNNPNWDVLADSERERTILASLETAYKAEKASFGQVEKERRELVAQKQQRQADRLKYFSPRLFSTDAASGNRTFIDFATWLPLIAPERYEVTNWFDDLFERVGEMTRPSMDASKAHFGFLTSLPSSRSNAGPNNPLRSTQSGMSTYWNWVVYTHAPQLVHAFGTLKFLPPEVVPQSLVGSLKMEGVSWE